MEKGSTKGTCSVKGVSDSPDGRAYLDFLGLPITSKSSVKAGGDSLEIDFVPAKGKTRRGLAKFDGKNRLILCISTGDRPRGPNPMSCGDGSPPLKNVKYHGKSALGSIPLGSGEGRTAGHDFAVKSVNFDGHERGLVAAATTKIPSAFFTGRLHQLNGERHEDPRESKGEPRVLSGSGGA